MATPILVPLDGSELAELALPHATALGRHMGASLVLMRAVQVSGLPGTDTTDAQGRAVQEAESYLAGIARLLAERGVMAEAATPYGEAAGWIVEEARLREAGLIVMSTHGRSGMSRWMHGSVAEQVLSKATVPVLMVRAWEREVSPVGEHPRLLVPLDGTSFAESALPVARELAQRLAGDLVLVHAKPVAQSNLVYGAPGAPLWHGTYSTPYMQPFPVAYPVGATVDTGHDSYLRRVAGELTHEGTVVEIDNRDGDVVEVITDAAREHGAALVVMATSARTGLRRAALGSIAGEVLRKGATPLVLLRSTGGNVV